MVVCEGCGPPYHLMWTQNDGCCLQKSVCLRLLNAHRTTESACQTVYPTARTAHEQREVMGADNAAAVTHACAKTLAVIVRVPDLP